MISSIASSIASLRQATKVLLHFGVRFIVIIEVVVEVARVEVSRLRDRLARRGNERPRAVQRDKKDLGR